MPEENKPEVSESPKRTVRVYVTERPGGGCAVLLTSSGFADAKAVVSFRSRERATRVAQAIIESIQFAAPEIEVVGPLQGVQ